MDGILSSLFLPCLKSGADDPKGWGVLHHHSQAAWTDPAGPHRSEPAFGHPFVFLDGKSHREVKTQRDFQDGQQGAKGRIVADLEVFNFHSTVKSFGDVPIPDPSSVLKERKLTTNCEGPNCKGPNCEGPNREGPNCEGPLMAEEGDQFLQLRNPAAR